MDGGRARRRSVVGFFGCSGLHCYRAFFVPGGVGWRRSWRGEGCDVGEGGLRAAAAHHQSAAAAAAAVVVAADDAGPGLFRLPGRLMVRSTGARPGSIACFGIRGFRGSMFALTGATLSPQRVCLRGSSSMRCAARGGSLWEQSGTPDDRGCWADVGLDGDVPSPPIAGRGRASTMLCPRGSTVRTSSRGSRWVTRRQGTRGPGRRSSRPMRRCFLRSTSRFALHGGLQVGNPKGAGKLGSDHRV